MKLPVMGAAFAHGRTEVTARSATNVWFEARPEGEKAPMIATHLPAKVNLSAAGSYPVALALAPLQSSANGAWLITSTKLHSLGESGGLGTTRAIPSPFLQATGGADLADNGTVQVLCDQGGAAFYAGVYPAALTEITIAGQQPVSVTFFGGYFVMLMLSGRIYWSTDGSTWGALDFAQAEFSADRAMKIMTVGHMLYICGERTVEFWQMTGNADLPFQPVKQVARIGIRSTQSACRIGAQAFLWGREESSSPGLFVLRGPQPQRLSTPDIERLVTGTPAIGGFSLAGHQIIVIYQTTGTFWYDVTTGAWTIVRVGDPFHGVTTFINGASGLYGLSQVDDNLVLFDASTHDEIYRELVTDHVTSPDMDRFTVNKVRLDFAVGEGFTSSAFLACSRDGGTNYGTLRPMLAASGEGIKGTVQFECFGTAPQFTFRVSTIGKFLLSNIIINPRN